MPAQRDANLREPSGDGRTRDAELARQLIRGTSGPVAVDKVIAVNRRAFHGVVYNLQTEAGWYIANGIITHNCRCSLGLNP